MAATTGAGAKAALTKAAKAAAADFACGLQRLEGEKGYLNRLVSEGILSTRELGTLKKVQQKLAERGKHQS